MVAGAFKVWRVLEEQGSNDGHGTIRVITKKEFVGEIENPKEEIFVTWMELVERFGEGYYAVEIPNEVHKRYLVPDKQFVRTSAYFEPSPFVQLHGDRISYSFIGKAPSEMGDA